VTSGINEMGLNSGHLGGLYCINNYLITDWGAAYALLLYRSDLMISVILNASIKTSKFVGVKVYFNFLTFAYRTYVQLYLLICLLLTASLEISF